jgi:polyhydroxyalkanoate synthase
LHLNAALISSLGGLVALPMAREGTLPWSPKLAPEAAELMLSLRAADWQALQAAVSAECLERMNGMFRGIAAYQRRTGSADRLAGIPEIWRQGATRLLRYEGSGAPVMFIPSLINRARVLDLTDGNSLLRWLGQQGHQPYLVDWGTPGENERDLDLTGYICGRLEAAFDAVTEHAGQPPLLAGYCMGGDLALALALRRQEEVPGLALLATPWDFHAGQPEQAAVFAALMPALDLILESFGELPVDILQALFMALDPNLAQRKFRRFANLADEGEAAELFVALEDWLNDGVPLVPKVARECLVEWYGANATALGTWRVDGDVVAPSLFEKPAFVAIPASDRIVPPASARALLEQLPMAESIAPPLGHIGMIVGGQARRELWQPLSDWLRGAAKVTG